MSMFLSRLSKLPYRKAPALRHVTTRLYSTPLFGTGAVLRNGDKGYIEVCKNPDEADMETIGSSHEWIATLKEGVLRLEENPKLMEENADPRLVTLPPLVTLPHCQTQIVTNVAMSSCSPEDDDECVLAVKFLGPQLSLCRPARGNSGWTNIEITDPCFFNSYVMYSEKDEMFSMPASGGEYIGSWNLGEEIYNRKVERLRFEKFPEMVQSEWKLLDSYCTSEQLVEFEGEMFLVKWYTESNWRRKGRVETQRFMVFKIDMYGRATYTRNIGDLCIILRSRAESFCYKATDQDRNLIIFSGVDDYGTAHLCD